MIAALPIPARPIALPPAALDGGPLESAPPKVGEWAWQPKVDDRRVVIHRPTRTIWNQYGKLSVAQDSGKFEAALDRLQGWPCFTFNGLSTEWLDCGLMEYRHDMMRGSIIVFDLMSVGTFAQRRAALEPCARPLPWATDLDECFNNSVFLIPQFDNGLSLYSVLKLQNESLQRMFYEGVVAKKVDSLYPMFQRPKTATPNWIKHRFDQ